MRHVLATNYLISPFYLQEEKFCAAVSHFAAHLRIGKCRGKNKRPDWLACEGAIYLLSEDHSAVMELVKQGHLNLKAASQHPDKNVLLRALGTRAAVELMSWDNPFPVRAGDQFVLCSDGLYDLVKDAEIQQAVAARDTYAACESLIALAKERGGYDNITAGVIHLRAPSVQGATARGKVKETRDLEVRI
jgi:protein phosphatase